MPRSCGTPPTRPPSCASPPATPTRSTACAPLLAPLLAPAQRVRTLLNANTRRRRRRDIAAHYDLGNELFELLLDPSMTYSCALFERPGMSLHEAALAKLERVCEKLDLQPDDHVLEIGSGWGAFALYAARTRGCHVTTTTISREQHRHAVEQVDRAGLQGRVEVLLEDYRDLRGRYDKLVSIEMIEAVGWRHFGTFFDCCSRLLAPDGAMLLQAITIDDRAYEVEKASRSFMNTYIFPNGCLPSHARDRARRQAAHGHARGGVAGHHLPLRADAASLARQLRGQPGARLPSWAMTSASSVSGGCTCPTARPALPSDASATCRCCWPSRAGAPRGPRSRRSRMRSVAPPEVAAVSSHAPIVPFAGALSRSGSATWSSAEQASGHRVEHGRRSLRREHRQAGPTARAEHTLVGLDRAHHLGCPFLGRDTVPAGGVHVASVHLVGGAQHVGSDAGVIRCMACTPVPRSSRRSDSVKPTTPAFEAA